MLLRGDQPDVLAQIVKRPVLLSEKPRTALVRNRMNIPRDQRQERALARAVGAEDSNLLPGFDPQGQPVKDLVVTTPHRDVLQLKHR